MPKFKNLLTTQNAKTSKGEKYDYLTGILYMLPDKKTCPSASKGCLNACLQSAGRGKFSNVKAARKAKKDLFYSDRPYFMVSLVWSIEKVIRKAQREGLTPVIRLNGTSDIAYENELFEHNGQLVNIFERFPTVQFYDYTTRSDRTSALRGDWSNYHLTFSRKEDNADKSMQVKNTFNVNLAVVFDNVPESWNGFRVINGDDTDLRFLDEKNVIVGLTAKGKAKTDESGFVVRLTDEQQKVAA